MYVLEKFINAKVEEYRKNHKLKIQRKHSQKWVKYLEIWDLKNGDPVWVQTGDTKMPFGIKKKDGRPWTYEEIAKYIYPDMQAPDQLEKAVDKVKKDYRAAYKLICGEDYDPKMAEQRLNLFRNENIDGVALCNKCPVYKFCKEPCPNMLEYLERFEGKQSELLVGNPAIMDLNKTNMRRRAPTAE